MGAWILGHGSCSGSEGIPAQEACECNVRVCLIIQWGRAGLGYMEEKRWEVTGPVGGFL